MTTGIVPESMKKAKVLPIFKNSGDKHVFKNYRPVSLLPVLSKVLERVVYDRLNNFLKKHMVLAISQYGFQENLSTELAMLELQDRLTDILSNKQRCVGIFMDLSKAFDTLDHKILIQKLQQCGIRGIALQWFISYLNNRSQFVSINGTNSDTLSLSCGVPQGSILGPLLFLVYINDLANIITSGAPILFADDTNCIYMANNYEDLETNINRELSLISDWFRANKLALNESKTKYIIFHTRFSPKPPDNFTLILNGQTLERVHDTKFLGVFVQENMLWDIHISHIGNKLSKITAVLSRLKHQLPRSVLRTIYNSLFSPYALYGLSVWGSSPTSHLDRIIKLQKKAVRHVANAKYNSHTAPLFKSLKILKVLDSYKVQCCKIYNKKRMGILHSYHGSRLISRTSQQQMTTRQANDIIIEKHMSQLNRHSLNYKIGSVWNYLPVEIKNHPYQSELSFVRNLKKYFLSTYEENCSISGCYICSRQ